MFDQFFAQRVNAFDFEAKMMNALVADFRHRISLENFDELTGADLQIKSKQRAALEKIEVLFQTECAAIKIPAPVQVL